MSKLPIITLLLLLLGAATTLTEAQSVPSCASKLVPCVDYLISNSTPPDTCCDPLKEAVANDLQCLCNLYSDPNMLKSFNITVASALSLTERCRISSDLSACALADSPTGSVPPPPPGQAGGNSGAEKIIWTGISSLVLVFVSALFY